MARKLFCIPYAGGLSVIYHKWKRHLPDMNIIPIILRGRESRINEYFYESIPQAADDIANQIINNLNKDEKFSIFGHSMGAILAYETCLRLQKKNLIADIIFFSGKNAPNFEKKTPLLSNLPYHELKEQLLLKGGTPNGFFEQPELVELFIPIIRADLRILEEYQFRPGSELLSSHGVVIYGDNDNVTYDELVPWKNLLQNECYFYKVTGGHFFINENLQQVCDIIKSVL